MQTRKLKVGQIIEAVCQDFVQEGFGLSHVQTNTWSYPVKPLTGFVWGVLPHEHFLARVTRVKKNHFHAVLLRIEEIPNDVFKENVQKDFQPSQTHFEHSYWALFQVNKQRVPSLCENFVLCGGCKLLHLSYHDGALYKEKWLHQQLSHKNIFPKKSWRLLPKQIYHYRNHVQVHINKHKQRGFYAPFSYRTQEFPQSGCLLFDQQNFDYTFPQELSLVRCVRSRLNLNENNIAQEVSTVELNSAQEKQTEFTYQVHYPLGSCTQVRLPTTAFFQVNQNILPQWLTIMENWVRQLFYKNNTLENHNSNIAVLELFSGSGFISRLLSYHFPLQVVGVDLLKKEDIMRVHIENDKQGTPPLTDFAHHYIHQNLLELEKISKANKEKIKQKKFDMLLLNPPRGGFVPNSLHFLLQQILPDFSAPILYSSCNGSTLARDLEAFHGYGYRLQELVFMDFFPFTAHYESLALLQKDHG